MKKYTYPLLVVLLVFGVDAFAQISLGGQPKAILQPKSSPLIIEKPSIIEMEDVQTADDPVRREKPIEFAKMIEVNLTPDNSGSWQELSDRMIWRLDLESEDALLLMAHFTAFNLPESARLYLFNKDQSFTIGAFSYLNNKSSGKLLTYPIPGDHMSIQLEVAHSEKDAVVLNLGKLGYGYNSVDSDNSFHKRKPLGSSGSCNVNSNCIDSLGMQDVKRSVCRIIIVRSTGAEFCTGTLVNNTSFDGTPYVLTAEHAIGKADDAENSLFDFNYESPFCLDIDGDVVQAISGSELVARFDSIDLTMVKLSAEPPAAYRPFFSGWSRTTPSTNAHVCIHHPNGDNKKISFSDSKLYFEQYSREYLDSGHWVIDEWSIGTTEGGSSGAGIFNENQQLFGTLTGGSAYCGNSFYDLYARFDLMWNHHSAIDEQLKAWLDPLDEDPISLNGFDPYKDLGQTCSVFSNFTIADTSTIYKISGSSDYVTGSGSSLVHKVIEKFSNQSSTWIQGVSFGVFEANNRGSLLAEVVSDDVVLGSLTMPLSEIEADAMNYFDFDIPVQVDQDFSIQFSWDDNSDITFYQSGFISSENHLFVETENGVVPASSLVDEEMGASLLLQLTNCVDVLNSNDDFEIEDFQLFYPNPVAELLTIVDHQNCSNLVVYDLLGHVVYQSALVESSIDCSSFVPGIYLVSINKSGKVLHQRMIKN